jgi:hypothetical protein
MSCLVVFRLTAATPSRRRPHTATAMTIPAAMLSHRRPSVHRRWHLQVGLVLLITLAGQTPLGIHDTPQLLLPRMPRRIRSAYAAHATHLVAQSLSPAGPEATPHPRLAESSGAWRQGTACTGSTMPRRGATTRRPWRRRPRGATPTPSARRLERAREGWREGGREAGGEGREGGREHAWEGSGDRTDSREGGREAGIYFIPASALRLHLILRLRIRLCLRRAPSSF